MRRRVMRRKIIMTVEEMIAQIAICGSVGSISVFTKIQGKEMALALPDVKNWLRTFPHDYKMTFKACVGGLNGNEVKWYV